MFTGLIEEIGTVESVKKGAYSAILKIRAKKVLEGLKAGDSIAVNGICLTVTAYFPHTFIADVNLERAMEADGRFGGHIVSGHVDGVGVITQIQCDDTAVWYTVQAPPSILRYIVEKGSVTVDGISLTVARISGHSFSVSVIPHTARMTILGERQVGDKVNLETDIIGKYVEKLLRPAEEMRQGGITEEFLAKYGF